MVCRECPDGHWECGEDWNELCQGQGILADTYAAASELSQMKPVDPAARAQQTGAAVSGAWMPLGTFVATFNVYYRPGADGVPVVKIVPVTQYRQPVNLQQEPALQPHAAPQQQRQQQQQYARRSNEHHSGFRNDRVAE